MHYLNSNGIFAFKIETTGIADEGIFRKRGRFAISGVSDIIAIIKGYTFYIEVKTKKGVQSKSQKAFQMAIERNGGLYFIARCLEDINLILKSVASFYNLS